MDAPDPSIPPPDAPVPGPPAAPVAPPAEPRQRWRVTYARDPVPADAVGRSGLEAWQATLIGSGLPLAGLETGGAGRARVAFAAPLPATATGDAELAELWLLDRRPLWAVREALADRLPPAHRWIDAEDVWLGAPALAGRVVAADWRIAVDEVATDDRERLAAASRALLAARSLPRIRVKGTTEKPYDLRPLLGDVTVGWAEESGLTIRIRTRIDPEAGSGRPEEVVAALAEAAAVPLAIAAITRERLVLAGDRPAARRR